MSNETVAASMNELASIAIAEARLTAQNFQDLSVLCTRRDPQPGQEAVRFPAYVNQTASALTDGNAVSNSEATTTGVLVTPDIGAAWGTVFTDLAQFTTAQQAADLGRLAADAILRKRNLDMFALFDGFSTSIGSTGVNLTSNLVKQGVKTLLKAGVVGDIYMVLTVTPADDLFADLTSGTGNGVNILSDNAKDAIRAGGIPGINGMPTFRIHGAIPVVVLGPSETGDVKCGLFAKSALGYCSAWDFRLGVQRAEEYVGTRVVMSSCYKFAELVDSHGVELLVDGE